MRHICRACVYECCSFCCWLFWFAKPLHCEINLQFIRKISIQNAGEQKPQEKQTKSRTFFFVIHSRIVGRSDGRTFSVSFFRNYAHTSFFGFSSCLLEKNKPIAKKLLESLSLRPLEMTLL